MSTAITTPTKDEAVVRGSYQRSLPPDPLSSETGLKRAVIYIRVSTSKQAETDFDPDGLSLPAQREACLRKAHELGAEVVEEYMDRGESAKTADRPQFQAMIRRVTQQRDVDFVILDKINRFARNRRDDANVLFDLKRAGAALISVKENIDDSPAGKLMHGILATLAEFESANNGTEALKGMTQKAQVGGTPGRAPIGYRNIRIPKSGSKFGMATVEVDTDRAPHIRWAFEQYATGEWTTQAIADELETRGVRSTQKGDRVPRPLTKARVSHFLTNPYYTGLVTFRGMQYEGRHEPIIDAALYAEVQAVLQDKAQSREKTKIHHHYLKGTVFCGECGSRLIFSRNKGRGGTYDYFKCQGKQNGVPCVVRYLRAELIEQLVEDAWIEIEASGDELAKLRIGLIEHLAKEHEGSRELLDSSKKRLDKLENERVTLLRAHLDGAVPLDLLRNEQDRITREMTNAREAINAMSVQFREIETTVTLAINLAEKANTYYSQASPTLRRRLNQAFFARINVFQDGQTSELASPFNELMVLGEIHGSNRQGRGYTRHTTNNPGPLQDRGWNVNCLVDLWGRLSNPSEILQRVANQGWSNPEAPHGGIAAAAEGLDSGLAGGLSEQRGRLSNPVQRRLSEAEIGELVSRYREGASVTALARRYKMHRTTILGHLDRAGVARRRVPRKMTDRTVRQAAASYQKGDSLGVIAGRFGVDASTVAREFKRAGVQIRPRRGSPSP